MRISIHVDLNYRFAWSNTLLLALEAARTDGQTIVQEELKVGDADLTRIVGDAGVGERLWARLPGRELNLTYRAKVDVSRPARPITDLEAAPLHAIPGEIAPYLRASRYCQSDKFVAFVEKRFGHLTGGEKVSAIRDWIEAQLTYVPGSSDADTNVLETFAARQGVCRDYAHLICTMVRAAKIPARMVAAYSPDIVPPDFHALAEIWLGGQWRLVDPTGMSGPDSTAVIAVGRDAYDIAFMESEAPAEMLSQSIFVTRE